MADRHDISLEPAAGVRFSGHAEATPDLPWFRAVVVVAIVTTVLITWPLWSPRDRPVVLPAVDLPQLALGPALIAASLISLLVLRGGALAVTLLFAYGMATDQTRMQPEFFSLPLLLWGSQPNPDARLIARAHLISLWFFAGLHKILSPNFVGDAGPRMVRGLLIPVPEHAVQLAVIGIAALEISTALLALIPATRVIAAWSALALHAGILLTLIPMSPVTWGPLHLGSPSPSAEQWNIAIWPWNIALACSGFALIASWRRAPLSERGRGEAAGGRTSFPPFPRAPLPPSLSAAAAIMLAVVPAGFYLGVVDAYPAYHLYSAGTANASIYCPAGCRPEQDLNATWHAFNVPLPPEPRLFEATFNATCAPGDVLRITEPHPPPWDARRSDRIHACPAGPLPASHP
jgi:hypothetical protein